MIYYLRANVLASADIPSLPPLLSEPNFFIAKPINAMSAIIRMIPSTREMTPLFFKVSQILPMLLNIFVLSLVSAINTSPSEPVG